jgi:PKD repeat protein
MINDPAPNGIYRYELDFGDGFFANVGCSMSLMPPTNWCRLLGLLSPGYTLLFGACSGQTSYTYTAAGNYTVKSSVYNNECSYCGSFFSAGCANSTVQVDVIP